MTTYECYKDYRYLRHIHGPTFAAQVYPDIDAALYPRGKTFDFLAWAGKRRVNGPCKLWDAETWLEQRYFAKGFYEA